MSGSHPLFPFSAQVTGSPDLDGHVLVSGPLEQGPRQILGALTLQQAAQGGVVYLAAGPAPDIKCLLQQAAIARKQELLQVLSTQEVLPESVSFDFLAGDIEQVAKRLMLLMPVPPGGPGLDYFHQVGQSLLMPTLKSLRSLGVQPSLEEVVQLLESPSLYGMLRRTLAMSGQPTDSLDALLSSLMSPDGETINSKLFSQCYGSLVGRVLSFVRSGLPAHLQKAPRKLDLPSLMEKGQWLLAELDENQTAFREMVRQQVLWDTPDYRPSPRTGPRPSTLFVFERIEQLGATGWTAQLINSQLTGGRCIVHCEDFEAFTRARPELAEHLMRHTHSQLHFEATA